MILLMGIAIGFILCPVILFIVAWSFERWHKRILFSWFNGHVFAAIVERQKRQLWVMPLLPLTKYTFVSIVRSAEVKDSE